MDATHASSAPVPQCEGSEKISTNNSAAAGAPTNMNGSRRPRWDCQASESEPMSGSTTASTTSPTEMAAPARPPGKPQTAVR